jgi:hypothetical protein
VRNTYHSIIFDPLARVEQHLSVLINLLKERVRQHRPGEVTLPSQEDDLRTLQVDIDNKVAYMLQLSYDREDRYPDILHKEG